MVSKVKLCETEILEQTQKHKKAILFEFFDSAEDLDISSLEINSIEEERTRATITFVPDNKVIYDSGSLKLEQGFKRYISWLNQNILNNRKIYCKTLLEYPECGFLVYVDERKCNDLKEQRDYYYRYGNLAAVVASLGGKILSRFNVASMAGQPVVKDITLLLKNPPNYNKEMPTYQEFLNVALNEFQHQFLEEIRNGYRDMYIFIKDNEEDLKDIIKLCFSYSGVNSGR